MTRAINVCGVASHSEQPGDDMTDERRGPRDQQPEEPGWWLASDGKWYPPESAPTQQQPTAPQTQQLPAGTLPSSGTRWFEQTWFLIVALLFCFPVGLFLVWRKPWHNGVKIAITAAFAALLIATAASGSGQKSKNATTSATAQPTTIEQPNAPVTTARSTTTTRTTPPRTTPPPTRPPTTQPRTTQPPQTSPPATQPPPPAPTCGAPANPYGYNFCHRGAVVFNPPQDICSYFNCIASFSNGSGYMEQCADDTYSMSGGRRGACSSHGGEQQPVYSGP
jgi:hypothetical protein